MRELSGSEDTARTSVRMMQVALEASDACCGASMRSEGRRADGHSLHVLFCRPCSHIPEPPHSLQRYFRRPCSHFGSLPMPRTTQGRDEPNQITSSTDSPQPTPPQPPPQPIPQPPIHDDPSPQSRIRDSNLLASSSTRNASINHDTSSA